MSFTTINGAITPNPIGMNQIAYCIRSDIGQIAALDLLSPGIATDFGAVRSHIVGATPQDSGKKFRLLRVTCYGKGLITGGQIYFTSDSALSDSFPYPATTADPNRSILWVQGALAGEFRWLDVAFLWQGIGCEIWRIEPEWTEVQ